MSSKSIYPVNELSFRIGRKIRRHRRQDDLTQKELAQKAGVTNPAYVSLVEHGRIWVYEQFHVPKAVSTVVTGSGYIPENVLFAIDTRLKRVAEAQAMLNEAIADLEDLTGLEQWL